MGIKNYKIKEVYAEVVFLNQSKYTPILGRGFTAQDVYDVTFSTTNDSITFTISSFEYNVLKVGDKGALIYQGKDIIGFSDKMVKNT